MNSNDSTFQDRLPPQDLDAERSILGACLIDEEVPITIISLLKPEQFYKGAHKVIFEAIVTLCGQHESIDILTLRNALTQKGTLEEAGGASYLAEIQASIATAAHCETHAKIVKEKYLLRQLIITSNKTINNIFKGSQSAQDIIDDTESAIFEIAEAELKKDALPLRDILKQTIHDLDDNNWKPRDGIRTGFRRLDSLTLGFHPGELIILAARPSMGKTSLALNICKHMAINEDAPVAFFSLEMASDQIAKNLLCMHAKIDSGKFRAGTLPAEERPNILNCVDTLSEASIFIDDTPGISPFELRLSARRLKERYGIKAIFVDYLQLMRMNERTESRQIEISKISGSLKALAMELKIPVIAMSQLSRKLEERTDKRPMMSDLRESGSIEQDADVILMLFREWVYNKEKSENVAELIIVKQRNGAVGKFPLVFLGEQLRFENLEMEHGF
ncbi:MAG: replicative DNA helicase [Planctomycetota bacterium]|nr:MAG: replicative DNA helicase [Planctomycetota bacterium]